MTARRAVRWTLVALAPLAAACGGTSGTTGLDEDGLKLYAGGPATGVRERLDPALFGTWSRTIVVTGASGFLQTSETRWTFAADGRVERRLVTIDFGSGLGDQIVTAGTWTTSGSASGAGVVTIRFDGSGAGVSFDYMVTTTLDGTRLRLDSLLFERVSS